MRIECQQCHWVGDHSDLIAPTSDIEPSCPNCLSSDFLDVEDTEWEATMIEDILKEPDYDCGLMNDYGGGNVEWWQDYIRTEIDKCNEYWRSVIESYLPIRRIP